MANTAMVRARIDGRLKAEAEAVLEKIGLNASDAIRLFYRQVTMRKGLPFDVVIPSAKTRRALREADEGRNLLGRFDDADEMLRQRISTHPRKPDDPGARDEAMSVRSAAQPVDIADRADEVYARVVEPTLAPTDRGRFVVLHLESEDFVVDSDETLGFLRLRDRHPEGTFFVLRAGEPTAYRIGSGSAQG